MMRNLIGGSTAGAIEVMGPETYAQIGGLLIGPRSRNDPRLAAKNGGVWAMDNDCWTHFNPAAILRMYRAYTNVPGCVFALAPDLPGDAETTLIRFAWWQPVIRSFGYPVGFALQNGQQDYRIPWGQFDALFVAGDTAFKLSPYAAGVVAEARRRGMWVHMGRVNSNRRIKYAASIGCDSFDGTGYTRFMRDRLPAAMPYQLYHQQRMFQ